MKNLIVTMGSVVLLCACGVGTELGSSEQDALLSQQSGPGIQLDAHAAQIETQRALDSVNTWQSDGRASFLETREALAELKAGLWWNTGRGEWCTKQMVRPTAQGTIQSIPKLGVFGIAPVGEEVQSSYFRSNGVNEEFRRGIAEFYIPGDVRSAVLQFREHRGWTSYPLPSDSHLIEAYPGNLELDPEDFGERAVLVGRFDTDPNLEPSFANVYDLTKPVQEIGGGKLGLRFSIEGGVGSGTSFLDLALEVTRCRAVTRTDL